MKRKNEIPRESAKLHGITNNHQNDSDPLRNIDPVNTLCLSVCQNCTLHVFMYPIHNFISQEFSALVSKQILSYPACHNIYIHRDGLRRIHSLILQHIPYIEHIFADSFHH